MPGARLDPGRLPADALAQRVGSRPTSAPAVTRKPVALRNIERADRDRGVVSIGGR